MTKHQWHWGEGAKSTHCGKLNVESGDLGGLVGGCSLSREKLSGGLRQGVELVTIDNGTFRFAICPTRGMGLWKAWLGELELGWKSPNAGPVHPAYVPLTEPGGLGWLDGFDELLVRCGLSSNGPPIFDEAGRLVHPLHGRIANRPARNVSASFDEASGEIIVRGVVEETRFHFQKLRMTSTYTTRAGEPWVEILDEIENFSASPTEIQMLYHTNFGAPLLEEGAQVIAPLTRLIPRNEHAATGLAEWNKYEAPTPGFEEQVYFTTLHADANGETAVLLKNAAGSAGASLHFSTAQLPCFSVWKNTTALEDGYVTGIEPGTNYPNPLPHEKEQGRVVPLAAGAKHSFRLRIAAHGSAEAVQQVEQHISQLQAAGSPEVFAAPQVGWCEGV